MATSFSMKDVMEAQRVAEHGEKNEQFEKLQLLLCDDTDNKIPRIRSPAENHQQALNKRICDDRGVGNEPVTRNVTRKSTREEANDDVREYSKSNRDSETETSTFTDEEKCHFSRLPIEVIRNIFSNLWEDDRIRDGNLRLVCKSWNDFICSTRVKSLTFRDKSKIEGAAEYFENCGYERLHTVFCDDSFDAISELPVSVLETFGPKIQSLDLGGCLHGDCLRTVILYCDNLKQLSVMLDEMNSLGELVRSLNTLDVTCSELESLTIGNSTRRPKARSRDWRPIFTDLIRIFPNIINFTLDHFSFHHDMQRSIGFSWQVEETDKSSLSSCLAYLMSDDDGDWRIGIYKMAKFRLTAVSLDFLSMNRSDENSAAILNLFTNQKTLKRVSIKAGFSKSEIHKRMISSIFLAIIHNSPDLRQFSFNPRGGHARWTNNLSLLFNLSKLEHFRSGPVEVHSRSLKFYPSLTTDRLNPMIWCRHFSRIQHLTVNYCVSNELLHFIFQYMTNLKSLNIFVDDHYNPYTPTEHYHETGTCSKDYSINRLQNLEKLEIKSQCSVHTLLYSIFCDTLFEEFAGLPKLRYLKCFALGECHIKILLKMPSLTALELYELSGCRSPKRILMTFVGRMKNLHTIRLLGQDFFLQSEAQEVFKECPSLRFLSVYYHVDFYDPLTKEVRRICRRPSCWTS